MDKKLTLKVAISIFIFAVCWQLFFTSGIRFFHTDFDMYHLHKRYSIQSEYNFQYKDRYSLNMGNPTRPSLILAVLKEGFAKPFFAAHRLFQIAFHDYSFVDRPYLFVLTDLSKLLFDDKVILYRTLRAIIFAINTCLIFLIINRSAASLALSGALLYMTSAEVWVSALVLGDFGLFSQCGVILSILLFIKLTEIHPLRYKDTLFYYFLIMLASNFAVLINGEGRYLAIIFFLTLLIFRRRQLKLHLPMLIILLFMEAPVLGFIKKVFHPGFSPIDFASHPDAHLSISSFAQLKAAISAYKIPRNALGKYSLVVLYIIIAMHSLRFILRKFSAVSKRIEPFNPVLKERLFLFMLWFASTFAMIAKVRAFYSYAPFDLSLYRMIYFIAPFIIFLCYYACLMAGGIKKPYRAIFLGVCICLILLQVFLQNVPRINKFRGGHGNYFCAWGNVEEYIEKNSNNALALTFAGIMHYKPFVFLNSNNKVLNTADSCPESPFCDLSFIESKFKEEGFSDIFVAAMQEISFRGNSEKVILKETKAIDGYSGDLYDRSRRAAGRPYKPFIYLYHFKFKEG